MDHQATVLKDLEDGVLPGSHLGDTGLARANFDANFYDIDNGEEFWISGPKRDRTDARYSHRQPEIDEDVRAEYEAFLNGAPLPGRANG